MQKGSIDRLVTLYRLILLCCCITFSLALGHLYAPVASAQGPEITITSPADPAVGHPGTSVQITGTGFEEDGTLRLYTTADPGKCEGAGTPASLGLMAFVGNAQVTVADGKFQIDAKWPANAAGPATAYYICGVGPGGNTPKTVSTNTFTVAQPVTITVSPQSIGPGGEVVVSGENWLPPQDLTISVGTPALVTGTATSDGNGTFKVTLKIPDGTEAKGYDISVRAVNEPNLVAVKDNALTVTQEAATPTPSTSPTPETSGSPTPAVTATPTPGSGGGSGGPIPMWAIVVMGGLGVLLLIVGTTLFFVYSRMR